MTLPDEKVLSKLRDNFVVGWRSIEKEEYCGSSRGYGRTHTAVGTTNGAGGSNVQLFVLSPDLVVLHALPGFWHPDDLAAELDFALVIDRLWQDQGRDRGEKEEMFAKLHRIELRQQSEMTTARSEWQSFDRSRELRRAKKEQRDTVYVADNGRLEVKPLNVLMRERMMARPFMPLAEFDIDTFVDYGKKHYDNNSSHDRRGRRFRTLEKLTAKRARDEAKERARQRRARS